ncbi:MAG: Tetratricopeptide TPR_2 repeat protein [Candidatus Magasanikbacteria bacterium GW2011_GWC2_34_16]|uniref:Tetratricopeptide TPR_2 repeat protein n=2 Tax=Candidatus Magasanikiibacteriota TaxID=1752731 RepID=A0A0G0HRK6_9BACT|nr:MAG: Tetratricopeptide TPR_2 repeat protein [Candidatus Magasanikbacteria bacterium GW2011_GWC2_34_16]KKQ41235.1 MAG: Tetratricopeptide TPR_2 repeat protein [Candidatus Magasanikbacteria bacterium GW2011_GWA2_37_8]
MTKRKINPRPEVRCCATCGKRGHNRSTCPEIAKTTNVKTQPTFTPVKFFVHHVTTSSSHSPHVVNLRTNQSSTWDNVNSVAPKQSTNPLYHFYHEQSKTSPTKTEIATPLFADLQINQKNITKDTIVSSKPQKIKKNKQKKDYHLKQKISNLKNKIKENTTNANNAVKKVILQTLPIKRMAVGIIILITIIIAPIRANSFYEDVKKTTNNITRDSTAGFASLQESTIALMHADLSTAENSITDALTSFESAVSTMQNKHRWLQSIVSGIPVLSGEVQSRQNLILAGQEFALGNTYLLKGIAESQANAADTVTSRINTIVIHLKAAIPNYQKALDHLSSVKTNTLPLAYQAPFNEFKILFAAGLNDFKNLADLGQSIQEIFGGQGTRRYLLVFQNENEIRPTGGFMGSFALIEIKDGNIVKLTVPPGGTYDLKGQLDTYLKPPDPLLLANKRWEFQDSNWFPDFPASAEKMLWFYQHSRKITADGVIAINSSVLERLLSITGPITDTKRDIILAQNSAIDTIQTIVETGPEKQANKPKQILTDLAPQFIEYFKNAKPADLLPLLVNLNEALGKKEIQTYFTDTKTERTIQSFGWGGQILPTTPDQDYLMVINTNIQGQKSDARIKQTISHQAVIEDDGQIIDTVVITRSHTGRAEENLYGANNIDYIRIYVPAGSQLLSANGFSWPDEKKFLVPENYYTNDAWLKTLEKEVNIDSQSGTRITNEFGKTTFGNWIITEPGKTNQVEFTYRLPYKLDTTDNKSSSILRDIILPKDLAAHYQLIVQRQSGCESTFESQIIFPNFWQPAWKEGDGVTLASNGITIEPTNLETDRNWGVVLKKTTKNQ